MRHMGAGKYQLSTGKMFDAGYGGVIGIGSEREFHYGYDGWLGEEVLLTPEERQEVCAWMIAQWTKAAHDAEGYEAEAGT